MNGLRERQEQRQQRRRERGREHRREHRRDQRHGQLRDLETLQRPQRPATARALLLGLTVLALAAPAAHAQLLADVMVTTAIQAQFNSAVSLPRGTMRAMGAGTAELLARVDDAGAWTDWEVYTLGGVVKALSSAVAHEVSTAYAVAGYFEQQRSERTVAGPMGSEAHTRIVYLGEAGDLRLLYFIRSGQEVVWLTARGR